MDHYIPRARCAHIHLRAIAAVPRPRFAPHCENAEYIRASTAITTDDGIDFDSKCVQNDKEGWK
jgi:hypothetical protein